MPQTPGAKRGGTGYRGVSFERRTSKYVAAISDAEGKRHHLGTFATARDAALAYDVASRRFFNEKAQLNFPKPKR